MNPANRVYLGSRLETLMGSLRLQVEGAELPLDRLVLRGGFVSMRFIVLQEVFSGDGPDPALGGPFT